LALPPDERAEEGLLQLRVKGARIRGPHLSGGGGLIRGRLEGYFLVLTLKDKVRARLRARLELPLLYIYLLALHRPSWYSVTVTLYEMLE
jgi:hypothetical protein